MLKKLFKWLNKDADEYEVQVQLPEHEEARFHLTVDDLHIGTLYCKNGDWFFNYTNKFKENADLYNRIVGFPDLNKVYQSDTLWPFFQVRIPGLKQPAIKEILSKENIDEANEVALLKRFGKKTLTNPYELLLVS